ncbi:hypothetical protein [Chitinophaga sp. S165]|uniref:hypothetical protein n=1 Tax=Chitinophaga sp. S165 TaxID=2135462 RepID=UPI000D71D95F|nr:hypothetical protein [Chitinophaga sp. S165]PWV51400.1 hypothetical protein C7475_1039 [Chitinophaga sp. S165]
MTKIDPSLKTKTQECFVIMPIADADGYDKGHFKKVYEDLYKVACEKAGFQAIRADDVKQTNLIHLDILQKLVSSPMAICDLSNRNPNVLFELGLRQAFDKPTVLVQEMGTPKIFDISPLRYYEYRKELRYREVLEDQEAISNAIMATKEASDNGEGVNSIISLLSLSSPASLKDITENDSAKMLQVVMSEMNELRADFKKLSKFSFDFAGNAGSYEINLPEQQTLSMELAKINAIYSTIKQLTSSMGKFEEVKKLYDEYQQIIARISPATVPKRYRERVFDIALEIDRLFSNYVAKGNGNYSWEMGSKIEPIDKQKSN